MTVGPSLYLDPLTGDLDRSGGSLKMKADVAQGVRTRLKFFRGEWFLDPEDGTPWWEQAFTTDPNLDHLGSTLRARIAGSPGVTSVDSVQAEIDPNTRESTVTWSGASVQGQISGSEGLGL